ncbi:MAG: AAA family ATPase, partial [Chlorobiales bacterium]|nr:AAA family ATPase [Chlorobiales bacterium]
ATLLDFKQFNLIYGWNYSGKTTLSRAFRCFEHNLPHVDFNGAQVQLKGYDGTDYHLSAPHSAPLFRVFNSDFVRENLSFFDGSAAPILLLGAEDIAKQESLKAKNVERETLKLSIESNNQTKKGIVDDIEKALTRYARDFIKTPLAEVNYDKRRFEPYVIQAKAKPEDQLLDDKTLVECLAIYRATDKKIALKLKTITLTSLGDIKARAATILARTVKANKPLLRLTDASEIENWVNKGRPLHEGKDLCQFCGQSLPPDLLTHLTGHFSADYDDLMNQLCDLTNDIEAACGEEIATDNKNDFYPELVDRFSKEKSLLGEAMKTRTTALRILLAAVAAKQTKAFTSMECPLVNDPIDQVASAVEAINKTIVEHNGRTDAFEKKRQEAFGKLEKHYAALFVREEKYNESLQLTEELKNTIAEQTKTLSELVTEICKLEADLSEAVKGAQRINELLVAYFGKNDLNVVVLPEQRFQIVRGGVVAKNLSEGEKTAIAFTYFITRVQDGRHPLADLRIVIDDPISSLDANHLFNTYSLIKTQLAGCRQLFLSTHSFEFFNLVREWLAEEEHTKKPQAEWKKWGVFLVKRTDEGHAVLEEIPKELLKFKSEYHYLFSTLYHFDKAGAGDFDCLLSLPNVIRRFMEAFGGIMIPLSTGLKGKMDRIFLDEIVRERVWKFINYYSHNTTITRSLTIPDMSECKEVVQACMKAVLDWDADYFMDLVAEVA